MRLSRSLCPLQLWDKNRSKDFSDIFIRDENRWKTNIVSKKSDMEKSGNSL